MRILLGPTTTCQARDTGRRPLWSDVRQYLALSRIAATSVATCGRIEIGGRWLDAGSLLLWVEDWGAGVAAEDLPHVFEPFFTTKRAGTGLDLAIARKVVEALGGSIRMESRLGQGTRVEIRLKTAPGPERPNTPANAALTPGAQLGNVSPATRAQGAKGEMS